MLAIALVASAAGAAPTVTQAELDEQVAHSQGACGSMGVGSGLSPDGRGWVASMVPGLTEFRIRGGWGDVTVTTARRKSADMDAGRPYYLEVRALPGAVLEWKVPGRDWAPISKYFLYPASAPAPGAL